MSIVQSFHKNNFQEEIKCHVFCLVLFCNLVQMVFLKVHHCSLLMLKQAFLLIQSTLALPTPSYYVQNPDSWQKLKKV